MTDNRLVCTRCDTIVVLELSYDGYMAKCDCHTYQLAPGSGDKPGAWTQADNLNNPANFSVYREGHVYDGAVVETPFVKCAVCNEQDSVSISTEAVDVAGYDLKVHFECENEHYQGGRPVSTVAYYNGSLGTGKFLREEANEMTP